MERKYKISLLVQEKNETITLEGTLDSKDLMRLEDFIEYAEELLGTSFVQNGMKSKVGMSWERESGELKFSTQIPPWDDVIVFLHKYRPIGLQNESTYFLNICSILSKKLADPYFREWIKMRQDVFKGDRLQAMYKLSINNVVINSEKVLDNYLNAYEYHRDKDKKAIIDSLTSLIPSDVLKGTFLQLLAEKTYAIAEICAFSKKLLDHQ